MNVYLNYLYRDASNWKAGAEVVLRGPATEAELAAFRAAIDAADRMVGVDPGDFVPTDLGIQPAQYAFWAMFEASEDDHVFNEILELSLTSAEPSADAPAWADVLAAAQRAAAVGWDIGGAMTSLDIS